MADLATFLGQVKRALRAGGPPGDGAGRLEAEFQFQVLAMRQRAAAQWQELWQRFANELQALGGQGHLAADLDEAAGVVARLAGERGARKIVTWDLAALGFGAVPDALRERGLEVVIASPSRAELADPAVRARLRTQLAEANLGITGADYAVAETGTLLLISGEGRSRLVSLLPRIHVALIRKEHLVPAMRDMHAILEVEQRGGRAADASCLNFITGPSRSADIEF
ncbi:MAG TPA: lactate utilization protein, partial [Candidatus Methylomirabilis sp.]